MSIHFKIQKLLNLAERAGTEAEAQSAMTDTQTLTCCCCGNTTKGRQWHNRDTGYGLCVDCIDYCQRGQTAESFRSCYGDKGIHYAVET